jgi:hypothetical protein
MLAGESDDRLDVGIRVRGVRDMSSARKRNDLYTRQHLRELGNYRGEGPRALVAAREEGWLREFSNPFEVEGKLLWIVRLIEKGWCILDERLLELGRELNPRAGAKRDCLDELFGGSGMVARSDPPDDGGDPLAYFLEHRGYGGISGEQGEQRRLVADKASEEVGTLAGQPKCDRGPKGVAGHPCRLEPQVLDQRSEVSNVLAHATLSGGSRAFAVPAAVIRENAKRIGQARND